MTSAWARPRAARAGTGLAPGPGRDRRVSLAWPRLPAAAEVAIIAAGYAGYALVRLAVRASRPAAIAHAAGLWRAERWLHVDIEPSLNHLAAARPVLAETAGYYYGLAHFIVTPLVLAWLWLRRPAAFGPLRSALVLATTGANAVFWAWPVAPPRFAVPGMTDVLVRYRILGAGDAHGPDSLVNLYGAMPSLHVAWAAWCAVAIVAATRGRWRHLAWLYPAATTVVVLATANHFVLDAAAGLAITALGLLATRAATRPDATEPGPGGAVPAAGNRKLILLRLSGELPAVPGGGQQPEPGRSRLPRRFASRRRGRTRSTSLVSSRPSCPPGHQACECSPQGPARPAGRRRQRQATGPAPGHRPVQGRRVAPSGTAAAPRPSRLVTSVAARRSSPADGTKKGTCHEHATHPPPGRQRRVRGGRPGRPVRCARRTGTRCRPPGAASVPRQPPRSAC